MVVMDILHGIEAGNTRFGFCNPKMWRLQCSHQSINTTVSEALPLTFSCEKL